MYSKYSWSKTLLRGERNVVVIVRETFSTFEQGLNFVRSMAVGRPPLLPEKLEIKQKVNFPLFSPVNGRQFFPFFRSNFHSSFFFFNSVHFQKLSRFSCPPPQFSFYFFLFPLEEKPEKKNSTVETYKFQPQSFIFGPRKGNSKETQKETRTRR